MAISVSASIGYLSLKRGVFSAFFGVPSIGGWSFGKTWHDGRKRRSLRGGGEDAAEPAKARWRREFLIWDLIWDLFRRTDFAFTFGHFFQGFFT
jgi:hypothetical protein